LQVQLAADSSRDAVLEELSTKVSTYEKRLLEADTKAAHLARDLEEVCGCESSWLLLLFFFPPLSCLLTLPCEWVCGVWFVSPVSTIPACCSCAPALLSRDLFLICSPHCLEQHPVSLARSTST
jgi:hypothetical protein